MTMLINRPFASGPSFLNVVTFEASDTFEVPGGITKIRVKMWGAGGGAYSQATAINCGGGGGFIQADIAVTPGETLTINIGGGGASNQTAGSNGGGAGWGGNTRNGSGGGGRTEVVRGSTRLIVAGGGGGSGAGFGGGGGGGDTGEDGYASSGASYQGGYGGTQSAGGAGGPAQGTPGVAGSAGASLQGGNGGGNASTISFGGGGGGGGYYGGGGGGSSTSQGAGGGGGGSSWSDGDNVTTESGQGYGDATPGTAANTVDEDYLASKGYGGQSAGVAGQAGYAVIRY